MFEETLRLTQKLLRNYEEIANNMNRILSITWVLKYASFTLIYHYPESLHHVCDEQGEAFQQVIKIIEERMKDKISNSRQITTKLVEFKTRWIQFPILQKVIKT